MLFLLLPFLRVLRGSLFSLFLTLAVAQAAPYPEPVHGDFVIRDFRFAGGEVLPELKLHFFTLGSPARDANGRVTNAVLLLHGTYGKGTNFLTDGFAGELFGTGQPLDAGRFYIIVPDNLGHGKSTKPSDGLRAKFPRYGYADMVAAQRRLVKDGLGVRHLRLIVGTSMGGMHAWMWAVSEPDFMDAVLPLVCLPDQISGRNRMERRLIVDAIRNDPEWNGGTYAKQPQGLVTALRMVVIGAGSVKRFYLEAPTQEATDRLLDRLVQQRLQGADANDFLYAWEASRDYDPGPGLERIRAAVTAVNFEDDERNPPELGIMERAIKRVARGKYVLVPASERTRGHASFYDVGLWKEYLEELLARSAR
ncbi:MAG TPA: alpha/beta fold hydrolase [Burkholderiales bacterium]|jgi:homoserine O-acetyltransferase|nr:alpha/beta fold hydrolase [Burkholderiales bacterium]